MPQAPQSAGRLMPAMRYRALAPAIDWLCATFGFEKHRVVTADDGQVVFAQLTFGPSMILLGPVAESEIDTFMKQPDEIGGAETQSCYLIVDDIEAHCARVESAGAEIVVDLRDFAYGGRGYSCRDPEGHIWNFGTYVPGEGPVTKPPWRRRAVAISSLGVALLCIGIASWGSIANRPSDRDPLNPAAADRKNTDTVKSSLMVPAPVSEPAPVVRGQAGGYAEISSLAAVAMASAQTQAGKSQRRRQAATRAALRAGQVKISRLERAKETADGARQHAEDQLQQQSMARARAEDIARSAQAQLATERAAKEKAQRLAQELRD